MRDRIQLFADLWKNHRDKLPFLFGFSVLRGSVVMLIPLAMKWILDGIQGEISYPSLLLYAVALVLLGFLEFAIAYSLMRTRAWCNARIEWECRQTLFEQILRMGQRFLRRFPSGDLITRMTDDIQEKLSWFLCSGIFRTVESLCVIVACISLMIAINPWLTLFTAGWLPLLIGAFMLISSVLDERYARLQEGISKVNNAIESCFSAIRVVKAFGQEDAQTEAFRRIADDRRYWEIETVKAQAMITALYANVWQFGVIGVLLAGGSMVINDQITLGELVAFDAYVIFLVFPMYDIGNFFVKGRQAMVSLDRQIEVRTVAPEVQEEADGKTALPTATRIALEHVSVIEGGQAILNDVSLTLEPGERVAFVGKVGSGKSTLLALIPRLMDPDKGRLLFGGTPYGEFSLKALRGAMGYVPQEATLFTGTVAENIAFGRPGIDRETIEWAAGVSQLMADITELPQGFETVVGPKGITLSGGQKQRVSLARALAAKPRALVLDDCTSALDAETEAALWRELEQACPGMTVLLTTHRAATLQECDRVVVLDRGRLADAGRHSELLSRNAIYDELYGASLAPRWGLLLSPGAAGT